MNTGYPITISNGGLFGSKYHQKALDKNIELDVI